MIRFIIYMLGITNKFVNLILTRENFEGLFKKNRCLGCHIVFIEITRSVYVRSMRQKEISFSIHVS